MGMINRPVGTWGARGLGTPLPQIILKIIGTKR